MIKDGPCFFDNHMLVTKRLVVGYSPLYVPLDTIETWIHIFNIPFVYMKEEVGINVMNYIGKYLTFEDSNYWGHSRAYIQIRFAIDTIVSLKMELTLIAVNDDPFIVSIKYEIFHAFCFLCGILGHTENSCEKKWRWQMIWGPFIGETSSNRI